MEELRMEESVGANHSGPWRPPPVSSGILGTRHLKGCQCQLPRETHSTAGFRELVRYAQQRFLGRGAGVVKDGESQRERRPVVTSPWSKF